MDRSYFSQLFPSNIYTYDISGASTHFLDLNNQINDYLETAHMEYMANWGKTHKLSIKSFEPNKGVLDLIKKIAIKNKKKLKKCKKNNKKGTKIDAFSIFWKLGNFLRPINASSASMKEAKAKGSNKMHGKNSYYSMTERRYQYM